MKAIKKVLAVLACLCLVLSCAVFAVSAADPTGSITIQNPDHSDATVAGKTFNVYKVFNATTNGTNTSYSWYTDTNGDVPFYDFFYGPNGVVAKNVTDGNVQKAVEHVASITDNLDLSQFAESLHTYVTTNSVATYIDPVEAGTSTSVKIDDLSYGYYLVYDNTDLSTPGTSAVRSAVMLSNVNKDAVITLKANRPQVTKQVKENNGTYGKGTSVSIGDVVTFRITTLVPQHTMYTAYHYSVEDTMHDGMVLNTASIKVYYDDVLQAEGTGYDLTLAPSATVDFAVDFTDYMDNFDTNKTLVIEYDATVTNAIEAQTANQNTAKLIYSNDPTNELSTGSVEDAANVYSYQLVFTKFAQDTNGVLTNVRLAGAEFQLYRVTGSGDELITFTTETATNVEGASFTKYIVAADGAGTTDTLTVHGEGAATITLDHLNLGGHLGDVFIFGLSEGEYKLVETKAPDGYVLPDAPFMLNVVDEIGALGSVGTLNVTGSHTGVGSIVNTKGMAESILTVWAEITNKPGAALPETGGMGTTLFTVLGVVLMAGAVAFFTSRKRSSVA
ncbi:MAG: isopeptide-forming domain-containing fimbrial protein [Ruminococcaceae bacterium]|nr:isopeptide-forming domain-containing fimbrial protein [Oscillospiraceae bacterium]